MKKSVFLFLLIVLTYSCNKIKENTVNDENRKDKKGQIEEKELGLSQENNQILKDWISYYTAKDTTFSIENFHFLKSDTLQLLKGTIHGIFDKEFDTIYSDFIVFNNQKDKYIDFDSYNWEIDKQNKITFSVDQEIDLVNVAKKTVTRIAFNGSSQWVEEAFWKNDSIVVLLENTIENQPV